MPIHSPTDMPLLGNKFYIICLPRRAYKLFVGYLRCYLEFIELRLIICCHVNCVSITEPPFIMSVNRILVFPMSTISPNEISDDLLTSRLFSLICLR